MCWGDKGKRRAQKKKKGIKMSKTNQKYVKKKKIKNLSLWTAQIITAQTHQGMISCSDVHISS